MGMMFLALLPPLSGQAGVKDVLVPVTKDSDPTGRLKFAEHLSLVQELLPSGHIDGFTQTWEWDLACVESQAAVAASWHKTSDGQPSRSFMNRANLKCFYGECFRAVHDG